MPAQYKPIKNRQPPTHYVLENLDGGWLDFVSDQVP